MIEQYTSPVFANAGQEPWLVNRGVMVAGGVAIPSLYFDFLTGVLPGTVTFIRASTATYYDGVTTAKAEENLFYQSQDFTNATYWSNYSASISYTADTTVAPDGTTTADTMTASAGTGTRYGSGKAIYGITSGLVYTASLFVQAGTDTVVQLLFPTAQFGANAYANFDLSAGTVGSVGASATATISSAGGTWYRCSITATATASSTGSIGVGFAFTGNNSSAARLPSITAVGTETLILWGAQLEQRSSVTSYTATTTQPITNYIPVLLTAANNQPRFDHNPTTGEALGLLFEEQRTNLLIYSEEFDNAAWTKINAIITANTIVAPDGMLTADKLVADTTTNYHTVFESFSFTSGTAYTLSVFAKAGEYQYVTLSAGNTSTFPARVTFDLVAGTVTSTVAGTGSIQSVGNGWFRCSVSATATATASTGCNIAASSTGAYVTYTGDGYSGIFIWGAQLEAGAFPTSYIATTSAAATRAADASNMTGTNFSSWYNQSEGSLYTECATLSTAYNGSAVAASDGTLNNRIVIRAMNTSSQSASLGVVSAASQWDIVFASQTTAVTKFAVGYRVNDIAFTHNGATPVTDTSALIPSVNQLRIGADGDGSIIVNGYIRRIAYYPRRLSDTELQVITS